MEIREIKDNNLCRDIPECIYRSAVFQVTLIPTDPNVEVKQGEYKLKVDNNYVDYVGEFTYTITGAKYAPVGTYKHTVNNKPKNKRLVSHKAFTSIATNNGFVAIKDKDKDNNAIANYKEVLITKSQGGLGSLMFKIKEILDYWESKGNHIDMKQVTVVLPHNNIFEASLTDSEFDLLNEFKDATFTSGLISSNLAFYLHRIAFDLNDNEAILIDGDTLFGQAVQQPEFLQDIKYLAVGLDNTKENNPLGKTFVTCYGFKVKDFSLIGTFRNDSSIRRLVLNKAMFELTDKPKTKDKAVLKAYTNRMKDNVRVQPLLQALKWERLSNSKYATSKDGDGCTTHDRIWINVVNLYSYDTQLDILFGKALRYTKQRGNKFMISTSSGKAILFNPRRTRLTRLELDKIHKRFEYKEERLLFTTKASRKLYNASGKQIMCCPQMYNDTKTPFGFRVILEPSKMMDSYKTIVENMDNYTVRSTVKESFKGKPILVQWYIHLDLLLTKGYSYDIALSYGCFARPIDKNKMKNEFDKKCLKEPISLDEIKMKDKNITYTGV